MTDFLSLASQRRSTRRFTAEKLTEDEVVEWLKPALMSPSSKNQHSCEFILVDHPDLLHQLSECRSMGTQFLADVPLAAVVVGDTQVSDVWVEDAAVAATTLLYQAESMGLGACWAQVRCRRQDDGTPSADYVREILWLPDNIEPLAIIGVGHKQFEKKPHADDALMWEKVHFNQY